MKRQSRMLAASGKDALRRCQKSFTLRAAGTIRHVIGRERIAEMIQFLQPLRLPMCGVHEWQRGVAELMKTGFDTGNQIAAIFYLAMLPCGFEPRGMSEAAGWKRGIDELPQEPLIE